jgi:hypothetical protein
MLCSSRLYHSKLDVNLQLELVEEDPAAKVVTGEPLRAFAPSEAHFEKVNGWLNECDSKHEQCRIPEPPKLPTRVIDVSIDESQENVRLVAKNSAARYAALSYCWGKSNYTVTTDTVEECMKRLPIAKLPRTVQDAIRCARRIGIQYLWVDALCILQDSTTDKAHELSHMADYYYNASLTISAALSSDSSGGFLYERETASAVSQWPILYLPIPCHNGEIGTVGLVQWTKTKFQDPITSRGWTLQEHLLSPKLLVYGTLDVYWSCSTTVRREYGEYDYSGRHDLAGSRFSEGILYTMQHMLRRYNQGESVKELCTFKLWKEIVEEYSGRGLTNPNDRLPALSALAATLNQDVEDVYMAGIWSRWLVRSLAWTSAEPEQAIREDWVAPCWSWASLKGRIEFLTNKYSDPEDITELIEVLEHSTTPKFDTTRYGEIQTSKLVVRGLVETAIFVDPNSNGGYQVRARNGYVEEIWLDTCKEKEPNTGLVYLLDLFGYSKGYVGLLLQGTKPRLKRVGLYRDSSSILEELRDLGVDAEEVELY